MTLIRLPGVMERVGLKRAAIYERISSGLFTPPVKLGRASAWPTNEVDAIVSACIKGQTPEEVKALVKSLYESRVQN